MQLVATCKQMSTNKKQFFKNYLNNKQDCQNGPTNNNKLVFLIKEIDHFPNLKLTHDDLL